MTRISIIIASSAMALVLLTTPVLAQGLGVAFVATSTADSGSGTLRQALLDAQSGDTITFDPVVFPPEASATIYLTSSLPPITQGGLTIDASNAGMVLDGSADAERRLHTMLAWDVNNGIARRAWARNQGAEYAARQAMAREKRLQVTLPEHASDELVHEAIRNAFRE